MEFYENTQHKSNNDIVSFMWLFLTFFFAVQGDFTSVELRDGRVVFQFGFQDEARAIMITEHTYNTNNWIGVQAKRRGLGGCQSLVLDAVCRIYFLSSSSSELLT